MVKNIVEFGKKVVEVDKIKVEVGKNIVKVDKKIVEVGKNSRGGQEYSRGVHCARL